MSPRSPADTEHPRHRAGHDGTANKARLGPRERKKLMTRQAILDAAQAMFAERGYDNVTVAEIADAVNILHLVRLPDLQELLAADAAISAQKREEEPGVS